MQWGERESGRNRTESPRVQHRGIIPIWHSARGRDELAPHCLWHLATVCPVCLGDQNVLNDPPQGLHGCSREESRHTLLLQYSSICFWPAERTILSPDVDIFVHVSSSFYVYSTAPISDIITTPPSLVTECALLNLLQTWIKNFKYSILFPLNISEFTENVCNFTGDLRAQCVQSILSLSLFMMSQIMLICHASFSQILSKH